MQHANGRRLPLLLLLAAGLAGCGGEPAAPAPAAEASPTQGAAPARRPARRDTPLALLASFREALWTGDRAAIAALVDREEAAAEATIEWWSLVAEEAQVWARLRTAFVAKLGQPAWDRSLPGTDTSMEFLYQNRTLEAGAWQPPSEVGADERGDGLTVSGDRAQFNWFIKNQWHLVKRADGWAFTSGGSFGAGPEAIAERRASLARSRGIADALAKAATVEAFTQRLPTR